ncbi:MAG: hypothetical protein H6822_32025 [Planctomycetaceae bacterium]|nr:hypothetical protein [Planctomycetales bacterium]MCB9926812.1 hypothetical protein [Planctomycetaceae bacterium]
MNFNPYSSPQSLPTETATLVEPDSQSRPLRALGRWTLICGISAAPSFFWGCALHSEFGHILGMICGIVVFILVYTAVECTHYYHQIITRPHLHRTVLIGYGTRILISVIFPIGLAIDVITGMLSVALVGNIWPTDSAELSEMGSAASAFSVFLTTLVQGVLLNIVLFCYMVCVYALLTILSRIRERLHDRKSRSVTALP